MICVPTRVYKSISNLQPLLHLALVRMGTESDAPVEFLGKFMVSAEYKAVKNRNQVPFHANPQWSSNHSCGEVLLVISKSRSQIAPRGRCRRYASPRHTPEPSDRSRRMTEYGRSLCEKLGYAAGIAMARNAAFLARPL